MIFIHTQTRLVSTPEFLATPGEPPYFFKNQSYRATVYIPSDAPTLNAWFQESGQRRVCATTTAITISNTSVTPKSLLGALLQPISSPAAALGQPPVCFLAPQPSFVFLACHVNGMTLFNITRLKQQRFKVGPTPLSSRKQITPKNTLPEWHAQRPPCLPKTRPGTDPASSLSFAA